jgi:hypothetical protein
MTVILLVAVTSASVLATAPELTLLPRKEARKTSLPNS